MNRYLAIGIVMAVPIVTGCENRFSAVNDFYSKNVSFAEQKVAIKTYDSKQKWYILAYGNTRGVAPLMLATVIAEDGKRVLDVVEQDLSDGNPDLHYLSAVALFGEIQDSKTYDICGDAPLYGRLKGYAEDIDSPDIRQGYLQSLAEMCVSEDSKGEPLSSGEAAVP